MLRVYLNYPNSRVTVHENLECGNIRQMRRPDEREVMVKLDTISLELRRFVGGDYRFAAQAGLNDMWLTVDIADADFERAVVGYIHRVLARHYAPFGRTEASIHCHA